MQFIFYIKLLIFFLCLPILTFSQSPSFEFIFSNDENNLGAVVIEDLSSDIIGISQQDSSFLLFKLNEEGVLIDSLTIKKSNLDLNLRFIEDVGETYLIIGVANQILGDSSFIAILEVQKDFSKFQESYLFLDDSRAFGIKCNSSETEINCIGNVNLQAAPILPFIFKFAKNTNETFIHKDFAFEDLTTSFHQLNDSIYLIYGSKLWEYNLSADSVKSEKPNPFSFTQQGDFVQLDNEQFLFSGKFFVTANENRQIGLGKTNTDFEEIVMKDFGKIGDTIDFPAFFKSIDFKDPQKIYCGGTSNIIPFEFPFQESNAWFVLAKFDGDLNRTWEKYYGGDANYVMMGLIATNDGGCLMYGFKHDFETTPGKHLLYLLKVNEDGDIVTSTTLPYQENLFSIYPNPFTEYLKIRLSDNLINVISTLDVYDVSGKLVLNEKIRSEETKIEVQEMATGTYFISLKDKRGRIIETKKVVKQN